MVFDGVELEGASILITGGTGSFGRRLVRHLLGQTEVRRIIILSRDELKQYEMRAELPDDGRVRFFLGNVRDLQRLRRALDGVRYVVHAAALKQVPSVEYNPFEAVKTNIYGAQNLIEASLECGVERVVALSTDKASSPINLYGATKLVSDKLFVAGNSYAGGAKTRFSVVRYGNVIGSRGSVVPLFRRLAATGVVPITDKRMTRFWITLDHGVQFVLKSMARMKGGEIFVPKIPSMRITDLATAIAPEAKLEFVGIRPGEKLHEEMISRDVSRRTRDFGTHYEIHPAFEWWGTEERAGEPLPDGFEYTSDANTQWLDVTDLRKLVNE
jgi:UDP-N-acetylglucosamine 4,6-dehydratase/5-epimerase